MKRPRHRITAEENERWLEAKEAGLSRWHGHPCHVCGGTEKFVSNRSSCVHCQERRAREAHQRNPIRKAVKAARWRAKRDGLAFDLREEDLFIPDICPVLGTPMETPSLDRKDNSLGYVHDNVKVISWEANRLKHRLTIQQIKSLLKYMESK